MRHSFPARNVLRKIIITIYIILVATLITATIVERVQGTAFVQDFLYHSLWFGCMWGVLAVTATMLFVQLSFWRQLSRFLLHASLLVILLGALATYINGENGYLHLRNGESARQFILSSNGSRQNMPFEMKLDNFEIEYYPGTDMPADYISNITCSDGSSMPVKAEISMNKIFTRDGYRFYQSSFDHDKQGSILYVNYDPYGTAITYAGYVMLVFSMIILLLDRKSEFRKLLRNPLLKKSLPALAILFSTMQLQAEVKTLPVLDRVSADSLASKQIIYNGRVAPFNTLARDFLQKLSGHDSYDNLTPEQVIGGWLLHPEIWQDEPMILIKNKQLREKLGLKNEYAALTDLFDGKNYLLQQYWDEYGGSGKMGKAIRDVDEKVGLILMLRNGTLIVPIPEDGSVERLPDMKINAELLYNRLPFDRLMFMTCITLGILSFIRILYGTTRQSIKRHATLRKIDCFFKIALIAAMLFHLCSYILRWYISNRIPLSNGYETMQFLALCTLVTAVALCRRFSFAIPFGFILAGFTLLVAHISKMDPQITQLMPVLVSPWLSAHVSVIMIAYCLLAFIMLDGVLALILISHESCTEQVKQLTLLSRLLLYPAVFLLTIGIFLGAVWANVSWGSYWSWDPKEVWALITLLIYAAAFHTSSIKAFARPRFFHIYMVGAFLAVLMTYFGVNYLLGGMHSYA